MKSSAPCRASNSSRRPSSCASRMRATSRTSRSMMPRTYCRCHCLARPAVRRSGSGYPPATSRSGRLGPPVVAAIVIGPDAGFEPPLQQRVQEAAGAPSLLRLGQRVQLGDLHAAGQRVRDRGREQRIGGAGQQEAAGSAIPVHRALDSDEERRDTLDLVEGDGRRETGDEPIGIVLGRAAVVVLVEADERAFGRQALRQRGLPALSRADDADDRRIGESLLDGRRQGAGIQRSGRVHLLVTLAADCWIDKRLIAG